MLVVFSPFCSDQGRLTVSAHCPWMAFLKCPVPEVLPAGLALETNPWLLVCRGLQDTQLMFDCYAGSCHTPILSDLLKGLGDWLQQLIWRRPWVSGSQCNSLRVPLQHLQLTSRTRLSHDNHMRLLCLCVLAPHSMQQLECLCQVCMHHMQCGEGAAVGFCAHYGNCSLR